MRALLFMHGREINCVDSRLLVRFLLSNTRLDGLSNDIGCPADSNSSVSVKDVAYMAAPSQSRDEAACLTQH